MKYILYNICSKNRITKNVVKRIEGKLQIIYSMDRETLIWAAEKELLKLIFYTVVFMIFIFVVGRMSLHFCLAGLSLLYIQGMNSIYASYDKLEIKLLKQFERFIQDIRFQFRFDGMLEEALQEAVQDSEYEMSLQGIRMIESLKAWKNDELREPYEETAPNHYFLTFYALCETVIYYGDKKVNGRSLFLTNIGYLKEDVNIEILKREKNRSMFMGLFGVTILPVFSIKLIEQWGIHNMPELRGFYYEMAGAVTTIIITVVTLIIYHIIMKLKYPVDFDKHKNQWVDELLEVNFVDRFLMKRISKKYKKYYNREKMLKSIVYPYNVKELMIKQFITAAIAFIFMMILLISIGLSKLSVVGFQSGGLILSIIFSACFAVLGYHYEYFNIALRRKMLEINREEEVVRFQSIILILMYMDRVTIELVLAWMEEFAIVFKDNLEMLADSLAYEGIQSFYKAKETVGFLPFERILDCFIASDRIGISEAFSDVLSERIYYIEKHKQENEIMINNRSVIAKTIAFIPLCLVIIAELIVPFVYFGLKQLSLFRI